MKCKTTFRPRLLIRYKCASHYVLINGLRKCLISSIGGNEIGLTPTTRKLLCDFPSYITTDGEVFLTCQFNNHLSFLSRKKAILSLEVTYIFITTVLVTFTLILFLFYKIYRLTPAKVVAILFYCHSHNKLQSC